MSIPQPKYYYPIPQRPVPEVIQADVCVYGATSAGIAAAIQAAAMGQRVVLLEFGRLIGGMTTSGLSATDIGNKHVIGGLSRQFYRDVGRHYGTRENWTFEPHVAMKVYQEWLRNHKVLLYLEHRLQRVDKKGSRIISLHTENGAEIRATIYIDATYEGDLMAACGVSHTVGRESDQVYDEHYNGVHFGSHHHNFLRFVDPYKNPGDPQSGLLPGISDLAPGKTGQGDDLIQAYNFRLCLSDAPKNKVPFPEPAQYDPEQYELLRRYIDAGIFDVFNLTLPLPNHKADHNNWGAVNTDFIGANYGWAEGDYATRERIYQDHVNYQKGLFYFLSTDERLPKKVREATVGFGLAVDEFAETGNWPPQLYVREARRMISDYVITEHDTLGRTRVEDGVGMASYRMDSHNCKRVVKSGRVMNEGNVEVAPLAPFSIPFRAICPRRAECTNLIVPVCISASHIAYCSVRMETVFMILGQSAGLAAALCMDQSKDCVQDISYSTLEEKLRGCGQILTEPEIPQQQRLREGKPYSHGVVPAGSVVRQWREAREVEAEQEQGQTSNSM